MAVKDYLTLENARNRRNARLYCHLLKLAYGKDMDVLIGHHLNFQEHGNVDTIDEVPSADTLIFDHDVMLRVFGTEAYRLMADCAKVPAGDGDMRETIIAQALGKREF